MVKPKTINFAELSDGRRLAYAEYGDPNGKPIFYFHGWPGSRLSGRETHNAAQKLKIRVISPDRPGYGFSDFHKDRTLLDWPKDIIELADILKIKKFAIMGASGGGPYVAVCAYKIPERVTTAGIIVGLAPVNIKENLKGMALRGRVGWANYHRFPFLRKLASFGAKLQFVNFMWLGRLVAFPTKQDKAIFSMANPSGGSSATNEAFRQGISGPEHDLKIYTDDWGFDLCKIKSKVYLWYGAKDRCAPLEMGKFYKSEIPGSKLFIDGDGGHLARYYYEEDILRKLTAE